MQEQGTAQAANTTKLAAYWWNLVVQLEFQALVDPQKYHKNTSALHKLIYSKPFFI